MYFVIDVVGDGVVVVVVVAVVEKRVSKTQFFIWLHYKIEPLFVLVIFTKKKINNKDLAFKWNETFLRDKSTES